MKILIGNTGLIGKTISSKITFDYSYNSTNISEYNVLPDCDLYLSCLPATKWLVNKDPIKDVTVMYSIIDKIKNFKYRNVILFSTIDVYGDSPTGVDESFMPMINGFGYGSNRFQFESLVRSVLSYNNLKIFRLPALFGDNIKKNVLYDLLNDNQVENINSNSSFQWYNLDHLVDDISLRINTDIELYNLFPEPIETSRIISLFPEHQEKVKHLEKTIDYDYKTKYNITGYLSDSETVFTEIEKFVCDYESERQSIST